MALPEKKPATYEDLRAVPDNLIGEIVDGDLFTSPRPAVRHARASSSLGSLLGGPFDRGTGGPGGWVILDEPELHLGADVLVPDLAGWHRERLASLKPEALAIEIAPDWICEVLSPSTTRLDRARKLPVYARERVSHAWLIDAVARTLEVMRLSDGRWSLIKTFEGDAKARAEPFDAVELDPGALWVL
jgi:Uma2 family endonuclease